MQKYTVNQYVQEWQTQWLLGSENFILIHSIHLFFEHCG